jgi:hypothetical protein
MCGSAQAGAHWFRRYRLGRRLLVAATAPPGNQQQADGHEADEPAGDRDQDRPV